MEKLFIDLNKVTNKFKEDSVHLTLYPDAISEMINKDLEERMQLAQKISSMVLSLRKKNMIKVRQPLSKIIVPVTNNKFVDQLDLIKDLVLSEVNVKDLEVLTDDSLLVKKAKANFKTLGPRYGRYMKGIAAELNKFSNEEIKKLESQGNYKLKIDGQEIEILTSDVEILTQDVPGFLISTEGTLTVALEITITEELEKEGMARELVNKIQNIRKDKGFEVTDKINIKILDKDKIKENLNDNIDYICSETLTKKLDFVESTNHGAVNIIEINDSLSIQLIVEKIG